MMPEPPAATDPHPVDDDIRRELQDTFRGNLSTDRLVDDPDDLAALAHTDDWLRHHRANADRDNMVCHIVRGTRFRR